MNEFNIAEISILKEALSKCTVTVEIEQLSRKIDELGFIENFNNNFCKRLATIIMRKNILKRVNNDKTVTPILGEADFVYRAKLKVNKIFTNKELLLISIVRNFFKNKKILEIGCGAGQIAIFLKILGFDVEVCDFTPKPQCLFTDMCDAFEVNIPMHKTKFQNLDLSSFNLLCSGNIRSPSNDFSLDKLLFKQFLDRKGDRFVLLDWAEYSVIEEDKAMLKEFEQREMSRLLGYIKKQSDEITADRYCTLYSNIELTQYIP
jgi:hypothetical protein